MSTREKPAGNNPAPSAKNAFHPSTLDPRPSTDQKARYIMIGGFLGAGKTTAVARLAQYLSEQHLRVGLITNDQGSELVDTAMLRSRGFATEEIPGGCFCCRFNSLVDLPRGEPWVVVPWQQQLDREQDVPVGTMSFWSGKPLVAIGVGFEDGVEAFWIFEAFPV